MPSHGWFVIGVVATMSTLLAGTPVRAAEDTTELAKRTQNPVADLISVPLQSNFNFGMGPKNVTQYVLNVQPVIPFKLMPEWNLITRTILPIINQPSSADGVQSEFGLRDLNPSFFLSPAKPGALIWGVGPTFTLPTATDSSLGSEKWSMGPAAVALLFDTATNSYYLLLSGRWYRSPALTGPWTYVASTNLPTDFRRIPPDSPAGVVLVAVAGTPHAQEAAITNSIPQTATVPRVNGPKFTPIFSAGEEPCGTKDGCSYPLR